MIRQAVGTAVRGAVSALVGKSASDIGWPMVGMAPGGKRNGLLWAMEYGSNGRLRPVVNRVAEDCAKVRWRIYQADRKDPNKKTEIHDHPLLRMMFSRPEVGQIGRPNPWMSGRKLRKVDRLYLELEGESFIWVQRDEPFAPPIALWAIPPHWVSDIPRLRQAKNGSIYFDPMFRFSFGGMPQEMLITEIIWRYEPDLVSPYWRGKAPAEAVDDEVSQLSFMQKYQNSFYRNSARPDVIVGVEGASETQLKRLDQWWADKHSGFAKAFIPAFVNSKTTNVATLGGNHAEMQLADSEKVKAAVIRQNWNVPAELVGENETSNRAAGDQALRFQAQNNTVPRCDDDKEDWNYYLLPMFHKHPEVVAAGYDTSLLYLDYDSPVEETQDFILRRANEGLTRGAITVDTYLMETGRPPLGPENGGNERLIPTNVVVMLPDGTMATGPGQTQEGAPVGEQGVSPEKARALAGLRGVRPKADGFSVDQILAALNGKVVLVP